MVSSQEVLRNLYPQRNVRLIDKNIKADLYTALAIGSFMARWTMEHKEQPHEYWGRVRALIKRNFSMDTIKLVEAHKWPYHFTGES